MPYHRDLQNITGVHVCHINPDFSTIFGRRNSSSVYRSVSSQRGDVINLCISTNKDVALFRQLHAATCYAAICNTYKFESDRDVYLQINKL